MRGRLPILTADANIFFLEKNEVEKKKKEVKNEREEARTKV